MEQRLSSPLGASIPTPELDTRLAQVAQAAGPPTVMHAMGARPNFVKMAPVVDALEQAMPETRQVVVHTGQHYDREMSQVFFDELGMREPDYLLGVGSAGHGAQTARVLERIEWPSEDHLYWPDLDIDLSLSQATSTRRSLRLSQP